MLVSAASTLARTDMVPIKRIPARERRRSAASVTVGIDGAGPDTFLGAAVLCRPQWLTREDARLIEGLSHTRPGIVACIAACARRAALLVRAEMLRSRPYGS